LIDSLDAAWFLGVFPRCFFSFFFSRIFFFFILYCRRQITRRNQIPFHHMYITIPTFPLSDILSEITYIYTQKKKEKKRKKILTRAVIEDI